MPQKNHHDKSPKKEATKYYLCVFVDDSIIFSQSDMENNMPLIKKKNCKWNHNVQLLNRLFCVISVICLFAIKQKSWVNVLQVWRFQHFC